MDISEPSLIKANILVPALALLAVIMAYVGARTTSPSVAVMTRWSRWLLIAFFGANLLFMAGWLNRPFWVLFLLVFMFWFLLETIYNWIAIDSFSRSEYPLFPRFEENDNRDDWPNQKKFIKMRELLRSLGFRPVCSMLARMNGEIVLRATVFEHPDDFTRVQVLFLPVRAGLFTATATVTTLGMDGRRLVTDNFFLPYGGFYPENWLIERKPLQNDLESLITRHRQRVDALQVEPAAWEVSPIDDSNHQQRLLERVNTEMGFLQPHAEREEHGKITREGRYRVWKELWLLSYLGRSQVNQS